ncbi:MAG: outer membrane lipid asymmetry maintenance protein MlaD [Alphaproteobacteria bacterium RIFCSPHIGHO2_12_FULL_63_12]|nr:MAG: outer membrane lipid asymmetry maintenance protein MlaD [Alphaproteobacteria bacterium RIFCSPHIGHO2_12_FULL_63_12]
MSKGQLFESVIGVLVIAVASVFLTYAYQASGRALTARTYSLSAIFGRADGVTPGAEVRIAGVKVGAVSNSALDPKTFEARVTLSLMSDIEIPDDSVAKIVSDGLLGGAHVAIEPGGSDVMLAEGDSIAITQGSVDLLGLAMQAFTNNGKSSESADPVAPSDPLGDTP